MHLGRVVHGPDVHLPPEPVRDGDEPRRSTTVKPAKRWGSWARSPRTGGPSRPPGRVRPAGRSRVRPPARPPTHPQPDDGGVAHRREQRRARCAGRAGGQPAATARGSRPGTPGATRRAWPARRAPGRIAAADLSSTVTRSAVVRRARRPGANRLASVRADDLDPVELSGGPTGERPVGVGRAVQDAVVVDHGDTVRGRVDVELQVAEPLVDGPRERGHRVLQPGELVEVPAAVRVGPRVRPVEVGMQGGRAPGRSGHRHAARVRVWPVHLRRDVARSRR